MADVSISVVLPTRNRARWAERAVRSIAANRFDGYELIVADQSDSPDPALALLETGGVCRYLQTPTTGISAARNAGVALARGRIIAHTDDDCEVPPDWLAAITRVFNAHPGVDVLFGGVVAGPTDEGGFIPAYRVKRAALAGRLSRKPNIEGIGCCFAYRRRVWDTLSGFDETLGAGAEFRSAEETDFTMRALSHGFTAMETPEVHVIHHGFRRYDQQDDLLRAHLYGIGAVCAKHVRLSFWPAMGVLARLSGRWAFGKPMVDFGVTPPRWPRLSAFCAGMAAGLRRPINSSQHFMPKR